MNVIVERLRTALERVLEGKPVEARRENEPCLSPWAAWLLICLVRAVARQAWARRIIEERLNIAVPSRDTAGVVTNRLESADGIVPGLPEWEYDLDQVGASLTNRVTGETILCPLVEPGWREINCVGIANRLKKLRNPEFPEARLKALHSFNESLKPTFGELRDFDIVAGTYRTFYLLDDFKGLQDVLSRVADRWSDERFCERVARAIGDWSYLEGKVNEDEAAEVESAANIARLARARRLTNDRYYAGDEEIAGNLYAMWECKSPDLHEWVKCLLSDEPCDDWTYVADFRSAVQLVEYLQDEDLYAELFHAFQGGFDEHPSSSAQYRDMVSVLLKHSRYKDEVLDRVLRDVPSDITAIIALEHRPSEARRLFAAALRSDNGHVQFRTTEALAILDEPWSRKELVAALHESDSDEETMSLRAALRKSRDHSVHAEVDRWEAEHLDEEDRLYCWDYKPLELPGRELGFTVEQLLSLRGRVE